MSDDELWVELQMPPVSAMAMPPDRYPVPASTQPLLEPGTLVTMGTPGSHWVIDEASITSAPVGSGEDEAYDVAVVPDRAASLARDPEQEEPVTVMVTRVHTRDLWVYLDAQQDRTVADVPEPSSHRWADRLTEGIDTPPVLRPRPARELPSLTGRRLRAAARTDGEWLWMVALSEPFETGDDIAVRAVAAATYWELVYRGTGDVRSVLLHTLWAY